jgi:hypothetical protein
MIPIYDFQTLIFVQSVKSDEGKLVGNIRDSGGRIVINHVTLKSYMYSITGNAVTNQVKAFWRRGSAPGS